MIKIVCPSTTKKRKIRNDEDHEKKCFVFVISVAHKPYSFRSCYDMTCRDSTLKN
jgi:hypothetical protein